MKFLLSDGSTVDIVEGSTIYLKEENAIEGEVGPFQCVGFESDEKNNFYPLIMLKDGSAIAISADSIAKVLSPEVPKVEVDLGNGVIITVPQEIADLVIALKKINDEMLQQIADLSSGEEIKNLQAQVDSLTKELESFKSGEKFLSLNQKIDAIMVEATELKEMLIAYSK